MKILKHLFVTFLISGSLMTVGCNKADNTVKDENIVEQDKTATRERSAEEIKLENEAIEARELHRKALEEGDEKEIEETRVKARDAMDKFKEYRKNPNKN